MAAYFDEGGGAAPCMIAASVVGECEIVGDRALHRHSTPTGAIATPAAGEQWGVYTTGVECETAASDKQLA